MDFRVLVWGPFMVPGIEPILSAYKMSILTCELSLCFHVVYLAVVLACLGHYFESRIFMRFLLYSQLIFSTLCHFNH